MKFLSLFNRTVSRIRDKSQDSEDDVDSKLESSDTKKIPLLLFGSGLGCSIFFVAASFLIIIVVLIVLGVIDFSSTADNGKVVYESECNYENTKVTVMDYTNTNVLATVSLEDYIIGCAVFEIGAYGGSYSYLPEAYVKAQYIASKTWLLSSKAYNSNDKSVVVRAATSDQMWCDVENGCYSVNLGNGLIAGYPGGYDGKSATHKLTESDLQIARQYYSDIYGELYLPTTYNSIITSLNASTATYYIDVTQNLWNSQAKAGKNYVEALKYTGSQPGIAGYNSGLNPSDISTYYKDKDIYKLSTYCKATNTSGDDYGSGDINDAVYANGGLPIPVFYQYDYPNSCFTDDCEKTIESSGCGFTSSAMIVSYLLDKLITPPEFIEWSKEYYEYGVGMKGSLPQAAAEHYGLGDVTVTSNFEEVILALKSGHPVMSSQGPGIFTNGGHLIVLRGITSDGNILVNDPASASNTNKEFSPAEITASGDVYYIWPKK